MPQALQAYPAIRGNVMKKLICYLFGHKYLAIITWKNEQCSAGGWFYCPRCGHQERFQFDD